MNVFIRRRIAPPPRAYEVASRTRSVGDAGAAGLDSLLPLTALAGHRLNGEKPLILSAGGRQDERSRFTGPVGGLTHRNRDERPRNHYKIMMHKLHVAAVTSRVQHRAVALPQPRRSRRTLWL